MPLWSTSLSILGSGLASSWGSAGMMFIRTGSPSMSDAAAGNWGTPKSDASNATIAINPCVVERIHRLKLLTVEVKGGGPGNKAIRKYKVVKSCGPDDLVFQSVGTAKQCAITTFS